MTPIPIVYPAGVEERSGGFWLRAANLWKGRRHFLRADTSNRRRYLFKTDNGNQSGDLPDPPPILFSALARDPAQTSYRFLVLADTGQGTRSQYALVPLIRALQPDFMILNGDLAYPAGETNDYNRGFFKPYRGLGIPIWATMGNHEYYSEHYGQEFYDVFCRRVRRADWDSAGLRFVPQPGPYWELRQFSDGTPGLVVLGVDSGQEANLDGAGHGGIGLGFDFSPDRNDPSDARQHDWLQRRLAQADNDGSKVVILFHIPALVNQVHAGGTHLAGLHRAIASHPSVALVACGHVHNFQYYATDVFSRYLASSYKRVTPVSRAAYFVSGNGGAGLGNPIFRKNEFPVRKTSPTVEEWKQNEKDWKKAVGRLNIRENLLATLSRTFSSNYRMDAPVDADLGQFLSMLVVDIGPARATAVPAVLKDLREIVATHGMEPQGSPVLDIANPTHRLTPEGVKACLDEEMRVVLR